jgi:hypothetical protein
MSTTEHRAINKVVILLGTAMTAMARDITRKSS